MPRFLDSTSATFAPDLSACLGAKRELSTDVNDAVAHILAQVKTHGDSAVLQYTSQFDKLDLTPDQMAISQAELAEAFNTIADAQREALELAHSRIAAFHANQKPEDIAYADQLGVQLGMRWSAISSVGLYVPGGLASYPSSVLMNCVPARVAGVERIVMVVPSPGGVLNPLVLAAAHLAGVDEIYRIGGAQAIGALAYGTKTLAPVDKIVGPGNAFVAAAKRQVYGLVGIDMIAGPSEVLVIADETANASWVASDLLAQAEHDTSAQAIVVTTDANLFHSIHDAVIAQLETLPKADIAGQSWEEHGIVIKVETLAEAAEISDRFAPEHLELMVQNPRPLSTQIKHAGSIFLGHHTPEAVGDYVGGPNHVLPTARSARFSSGLSVFDFLKRTTMLECDPQTLKAIGPHAVEIAKAEDLDAHARSITIRMN